MYSYLFQVQNFVKAKDNNEYLSNVVSSLRMQLDESDAEKRRLHYENRSLHARFDENEHVDKTRSLHRSSGQDKDKTAREPVRGRLSRHGADGTDNSLHSHHTSLMRSESVSGSDRSTGVKNLAQVCLGFSFLVLVICPIAIAYTMGQIIKPVCICVFVHLCALLWSHFLIDCHGTDIETPKSKNKFVGG